MPSSLYPHQQVWLDEINTAFMQGATCVLGQAPTGFGKTFCFSWLGENFMRHSTYTLFLVHKQEIFLQTAEHLANAGLYFNLIATDGLMSAVLHRMMAKNLIQYYNSSAPSILAMLPTLHHRWTRIPGYILPSVHRVIIDEAHHSTARTWNKLLHAYRNAGIQMLGVTATPERLDGVGLSVDAGGIFDVMVHGPQISELVQNGFLARPRVILPTETLVERDDGRPGGYAEHAMGAKKKKRLVASNGLEKYQQFCPGKKMIAFCESIRHCSMVCREFTAAGIEAAVIDGKMDAAERLRKIDRFTTGDITILVSCDVIGEGMDVPSVDGIIDLRRTESRTIFYQHIGRALRVCENKDAAFILDMADSIRYHGHPMQHVEWSIHGRPPSHPDGEYDEVDMRICSQCGFGCPAEYKICPNCGNDLIRHRVPDLVDTDMAEYKWDASGQGILPVDTII